MNKSIVPVLIAGLILAGCSGNKEQKLASLKKQQQAIALQISRLEQEIAAEKGDSALPETGKMVQVMNVAPALFNHYIEVQGRLDGDENVPVSSLSGGKIETIYVNAGQQVVKGQILAKMDDAVLQETLAQIKSNLAFVTDIYEKKKRLWEQKIGSEIDYLTAKNNKENLEKNLAQVKEQISMMHLESPVNGTVEEISVKAGQSIIPGYPAFRIINFNKLKIVADVSEGYASKVNEGDKIIILFPDIQKEFTATVNHASDFINPVNRTFTIEAYLQSTNAALKANMVAIIKINDYHKPDAVVIPLTIVQQDIRKGKYVLTVNEQNRKKIARRAYIQTGVIYNGQTEVIAGLKTGDKVITAGFQSVEEGQPVRF